MNRGKFYAVGIGPGDPELITVKALNNIDRADVIVVPKSGAKENIALTIAGEHIKGKTIMESDMPMTKDRATLDHYHEVAAEEICSLLDEGKNVSFLTLGDPTIYSTVMYVHRKILEKGYEAEVIPGVPSFCATAAALNMPLCEREQMLHIIPATFKGDECLELSGTKVLMKSGKAIMEIKEKLSDRKAMLVERATMEGQRIYEDLQELEEPSSYFSIIVVPDEE